MLTLLSLLAVILRVMFYLIPVTVVIFSIIGLINPKILLKLFGRFKSSAKATRFVCALMLVPIILALSLTVVISIHDTLYIKWDQ